MAPIQEPSFIIYTYENKYLYMAKVYDGDLNVFMDFGSAGPSGEPASGLAVQNYIKSKLGVGYTTIDGTEHLFFADESARDAYMEDPTREDLIIDRIPLEPLYYMTYNLLTDIYNYPFLGDTGNYIEYTFETTSRSGAVISEPVTVTYTIMHGSTKQVVTVNYNAGTHVEFNVDKYLQEGVNNFTVTINGQLSNISVSFSVVFQVINLTLTDDFNIGKVYRPLSGDSLDIPYIVSGTGQKTMEWYIDGERVPFNKNEDEINDNTSSRTKYININGLTQGVHTLQFRVGININGSVYYSEIKYREFIVSLGASGDPMITVATELPSNSSILTPQDSIELIPTQYEPFTLRVGCFNPDGTYENTVTAKVNNVTVASMTCYEDEESRVQLTLGDEGAGVLTLVTGSITREINIDVQETDLDIHEITNDLELNFNAEGKNNTSSDREFWTDGTHQAVLVNFDYTDTSGWVDGKLVVPSGAHIDFDVAPLGNNPTNLGKTFEIEFKSINVNNDDAVLIDLINSETGAGIKITATEVIVKSRGGVNINRRYKTDEDLRISIVINKAVGSTLAKLVQVYFNGVLSMTANFSEHDQFTAPNLLSVGGEDAGIIVTQIRTYNTALDDDAIVNNFILYRPTVDQMLESYLRNDLYQQGSSNFDLDKIASFLPVMIITGDLTPIETATDNKATTVVDIDYTNLQHPEYSFKMKNAQMRPQGTSSLTYPRKNLRLYTQKRDDTVVYDYKGNIITNRLYSFKEGAQPVNCWTLKADFAESSSTHNTGVARIWNDVLKQTQVGGEYVLRTEAQQTAIDNDYPYDVRTTVDGFPIVIFHRRTVDGALTFLGKYNFNNDKSTESVFGFKDIPGFDNINVQCWEFRDSGFDLALFKTPQSGRTYEEEFDYYAANYEDRFKQVWESRYPDTSNPSYTHFKRLAVWLNSTENNLQKWIDEKDQYFDLYKLASYYVYLMRFGAVDQTVKNSMITTEDGDHWFFILYDNDTILGVRNDGLLKFGPTINRQTPDPELGGYAYAGHDSVLWNNFEADPECMEIVRTIDSALFSAGLTYAQMIDMFNVKQAGQWAEKVYNKDSMYKYIEPYIYQDKNYLGSLQGSRSDHRKWWISNRFSLYDALYVNDSYNNNAITMLIPGASIGDSFSIISGKDFYYGWGQNRQPMDVGVYVEENQTHEFVLSMNFEIGTPLRIYAPQYIKKLDISNIMEHIGATNFNLAPAYSETLGSQMKSLILGVDDPVTDLRRNTALTSPSGLTNIITLEELNVAGFQALTTLDLGALTNLKTFKAKASGLTSVTFANGAPLTTIEYPASLQVLTLNGLPSLTTAGIVSENNLLGVHKIDIKGCPGVSNSPSLILNWISERASLDGCELIMDTIDWRNVDPDDLIAIGEIPMRTLRGVCRITSPTDEQMVALINLFGVESFSPGSAFRIIAPDAIYITGPTSVLEGDSATYTAIVTSEYSGTVAWSIISGSRPGTSINSSTGVLTTTESGEPTSDITIRAAHHPTQGAEMVADYVVTIERVIYPSIDQVIIDGDNELTPGSPSEYELEYLVSGVNGRMTGSWSLIGNLASYATITSQSNTGCVVSLPTALNITSNGVLSCSITKTNSGELIGTITKDIAFVLKTRLTVYETTNQSSHADVSEASATVSYEKPSSIANGTYILYTDGSLSNYDTLVAGKTPVGPVLKTDNVSIVIHPNIHTSSQWSPTTDKISGVVATDDFDVAKADYAGAANTAAAIASGLAGTAFTYAVQDVYADGRTGYLPSCGEMNEIALNCVNINAALSLIGGTVFNSSTNYWTSTQSSTYDTVYVMQDFVIKRYGRTYQYNACRSVSAYTGLETLTVPNGQSVDIPRETNVTIRFSPVTNYATPATQNITLTGESMSVTGIYNTEVVTVTVTTDQQGVTAEGQIVTINGQSFTVGASGVVSTKVPYGVTYTVSANTKDGYNTPEIQTFTAGQVSRSVTMQYIELPRLENGVYIAYSDGTVTDYNYRKPGKTPIGVVLINNNVSILVHPDDFKLKQWATANVLIPGVVDANQGEALVDYAGASNTAAVLASGYAGEAFTIAAELGDGWYLPACGELEQLRLNKTNINTALNLIGGTGIFNNTTGSYSNHWSSTQSGTLHAWYWIYGDYTVRDKTSTMDCRYVKYFPPYAEKIEKIDDGTYIVYSDGSMSNYDTLDSGKTPVGVGLVNENVSILIHPSEGSSKEWSPNASTVIEGVTTTTDSNIAKADYAGKSNTAAVIASGLAGSAFTFATDLGTDWYFPACGEMEQLRLNNTNINTALNLIGGAALQFNSEYYWNSTQLNALAAWCWVPYDGGYYMSMVKNSAYGMRSRAVRLL